MHLHVIPLVLCAGYTIITDQGFFQSTGSRNEPLGYTSYFYCRSDSAVLIDCVEGNLPMKYTPSCPQLGVLCCPNGVYSMCNYNKSKTFFSTYPRYVIM